jgi:EAL and modified HD-GYP domain-containing signal transduction protein
MATPETPPFPLVEIQAVANARNEWVALSLRVEGGGDADSLHALFDAPDLLAAIAPLDCILHLGAPAILTETLLELMPPNRVVLAIAGLGEDDARRVAGLHEEGYRILVDGPPLPGARLPATLRAVAADCSAAAPPPESLLRMFGPHLAHHVDSAARFAQCLQAGFEWISGDWPLHPLPSAEKNDGTSRKRLLALLGLLARDADTRELETLLKQDPALSFHLLKLVNSAAFALSVPITSFAQAITVLGRRQLQRWLQLLLYARQQDDGTANPLLPLAAVRAAQMEALCKARGGDRDEQDMAFMVGVFALLDVLFAMPMEEIVGALNLAPEAAGALLRREGELGAMLALAETGRADHAALDALGIEPLQWWQSQLGAYHWAIQVSRNL